MGRSVRQCPYRTDLWLFNEVGSEAGLKKKSDGKHQSITWKRCSPKTTTVFCVFGYRSQRGLPVKMSPYQATENMFKTFTFPCTCAPCKLRRLVEEDSESWFDSF